MTVTDTANRRSILKRLREMLLRQRETFQSYLDLLEQEHLSIAEGDVERLQSQVELERSVIAELRNLGKVIRPLEDLYQLAYPEREDTVPALKAVLEKMGGEVKERNARNKAALKEKMDELRREITELRAWPRTSSPYAEVAPSLVDITT
jgi:flagellar biosynthesis/type III secretory pathway chaperone